MRRWRIKFYITDQCHFNAVRYNTISHTVPWLSLWVTLEGYTPNHVIKHPFIDTIWAILIHLLTHVVPPYMVKSCASSWLAAELDNPKHYSDVIMSAMASQITWNLDCLHDRLLRYRSKKTSRLHVTSLCERNARVNFPYKGPVMRKIFPIDDVIKIQMDWGLHRDCNCSMPCIEIAYFSKSSVNISIDLVLQGLPNLLNCDLLHYTYGICYSDIRPTTKASHWYICIPWKTAIYPQYPAVIWCSRVIHQSKPPRNQFHRTFYGLLGTCPSSFLCYIHAHMLLYGQEATPILYEPGLLLFSLWLLEPMQTQKMELSPTNCTREGSIMEGCTRKAQFPVTSGIQKVCQQVGWKAQRRKELAMFRVPLRSRGGRF